jgi:CarD family transcriptional regulator
LRSIISEERLKEVFDILKTQRMAPQPDWSRRYRANLEKMRGGNVFELAEVVRSLVERDREKGLSSGERKMLESAKQILLSEIILVKGLGVDQASHCRC